MPLDKHRWVIINDLIISYTEQGTSPDSVWIAFAKDLNTRGVTRYLATSDGIAEVNSVQRKIVADVLKERKLPVAAVTDERLVRGLVTAVSWLGVNIKPFAWAELRDAIVYLKVPSGMVGRVVDAAMQLKSGSGK